MTRGLARLWRRLGPRGGRRPLPAGLGRWGTREFVEARLGLLAAARSLDLVDLALALEREFDVAVPGRVLDGVRTRGELVEATVGLLLERAAVKERPAPEAPRFQARLLFPDGPLGGTLDRAGALTSYTVETIAREAGLAGSGARLDITLTSTTTALDLARLNGRFARLVARGIHVNIHSEGDSMATAWFGPCPHCGIRLSYLVGVTGSSMTPKCPRCRKEISVSRATFLMADHSRPAARPPADDKRTA